MRWVLTLAALSLGVWYLTNRRRRDQLGQAAQDGTPPDARARVGDDASTASDAAGTAPSAVAAATEKAQGLAQQASKAAGDAAAGLGQTSASVADHVGQALESATQGVQEATDTVMQTAQHGVQQVAGAVSDAAQTAVGHGAQSTPPTGATAPATTGPRDVQQAAATPQPGSGSAVETDVTTPPPSIRETVQAEMADVGEQVDLLRAQSEAPPDPAEKSAGELFGAGTMASTDVHLAQAPSTQQEAETVEGGVEPLAGAATTGPAGTANTGAMGAMGATTSEPAGTAEAQGTDTPVGIGVTGDLSAGAIPSGPANTVADDVSPIGTPYRIGDDVLTSDSDSAGTAAADTTTITGAGAAAPSATAETAETNTTADTGAAGPLSGGPASGAAQSTVGRTLTTDDTIVPEGERPRDIAGEGTTTEAGGNVNILSPVGDGPTATGATEPLPAGLAPGTPGAGGPPASTIAPSTPGSVETPRTGMRATPVVDRAAEITARTGGKYVGNRKKRVFHPATSSDLPSENNRVYFETIEEATAAGFTPASNENRAGA